MSSFDIEKTPFSAYGSWLALTREGEKIIVHDVRGVFGDDAVVSIVSLGGPWSVTATAEGVQANTASGSVRMWLIGDRAMGVESHGLGLLFTIHRNDKPHDSDPASCRWQLNTGSYLTARPTQGSIEACDSEFRCLAESVGVTTLSIDREKGAAIPESRGCSTDTAERLRHWRQFALRMPAVPADRREVAEVAWYNIWSCFMRREGVFLFDSVMMSKKVMTYVWSWDHCFVALALAQADPQAAMDQWMLPFPLMNENGCLPDMWKSPDDICWYATKPPIHGWCLSKLMDQMPIPTPRLRQAYEYLVRWTDFWMTHRDSDGDGVPNYLVAGNDSGWDNSTLFDIGSELESPDLSCYLILQMQCLARVADVLGDDDAASSWRQRAAALKASFLAHSWDGSRFVAKLSGSHAHDPHSTSLLSLMPLVLGEQLEPGQSDRLAESLVRDFLTPYGLATEMPSSPKYVSNGYWRGPIWAPSTYLIVDGLRRCGRRELAGAVAGRFCDMIAHHAGGNYENFDALTGRGLCTPGYTWTAAVNLLLMHECLLPDRLAGNVDH